MAFNWQTFRTRTLTAAVFVVVMLAGLLWNEWSFLALFTVIHFGCWWEYFRLLEKINQTVYHPYVKMGFMLMGFGLMLWCCGPLFEINGYSLKMNLSLPVSLAGILLLAIGIFLTRKISLRSLGAAALGVLYISLSWGLMLSLYGEMDFHVSDTMFVLNGPVIPMAIILSIWVNDTMAYIVGSFIGKTPLSRISPKKTWEGTLGGILLSIAVMSFLVPWVYWKQEIRAFSILMIGISGIAAIAGTLGDLLESKLKRMAGVKDSGQLMPGHGGFLDRFDSLLLAIPCVWLYVTIVLHAFERPGYVS